MKLFSTFNQEVSLKNWHTLGFIGKRLHGFACYFVSAILSLFIPEVVDNAMRKTLNDQFYDGK